MTKSLFKMGGRVSLVMVLVAVMLDQSKAFTSSRVVPSRKQAFSSTENSFDPETNSHLESLIGTLTDVLKNGKQPSEEEIEYFESSIKAVLNEAKGDVEEASPPKVSVQSSTPIQAPSAEDYNEEAGFGRFKRDRFDGILKQLEHPINNQELSKSKAFDIDPKLLGENVPLTKAGTPAQKALREQGTKLHQPLGNIQTNTWGTDPFAGFNFDGSDDEEESARKKREKRKGDIPGVNRPARSWGQRKHADGNQRPSGYDSRIHGEIPESSFTSLESLTHPAVVGHDKSLEDAFTYDPATLGEGVPRTKLGTPATKALIEQGQKTHQRLGNIQTNTWGTEPFAGYDDTLWGDDDEAGCD